MSMDTVSIVVIGDRGVGCSAMIAKFCGVESVWSTFVHASVEIDRRIFKVRLWDVRKGDAVLPLMYYRHANGMLFVYDVTRVDTFHKIRSWFEEAQERAGDGVETVIVGNKCDLQECRAVSNERGQLLADELGAKFIETSANSGVNINRVFTELASDIVKAEEKKLKDSTTIHITGSEDTIDSPLTGCSC